MADLLHLHVRCDALAPTAVRGKMKKLAVLGSALADAMLIASELVTNAVLHSFCTEDDLLNVRITRNGCVRISVLDPGASKQKAHVANRPIELGGLGLKVVEQLAATWGTERQDDGYRVWADLELPRPSAPISNTAG